MEVEGDVKIGAPTGLPSIKLSNQAIAKDCELDKQTVNLCLTNVFQVIGELLAEGRNIEIDLAPFGKLKGLQRAVTYVPPAKKQAVHGKQTVKALFDMSTEPKVGSKEMAGEEEVKVIGESFAQATAQVEKGFGSVRIAGKGSQAELSASTVFKGIQAAGLSPTRRFKKPEGSGQVLGSLLSAGVDPLAVSHEYSFLAKDTEKLMKTYFKKPPMAQARLPPVLDQFSRTIAAPITSQKHYFSICHKIGSHYTMGSRGLYVDPEIRAVRFKTIEEEGTKLNMMARNFVEPATEEEEYLAATKGDASLKFRVDARKRTYQRYRAYVDQEISSDEVAPINNDWLAKVTQKVPMKMLPVERTNEMLDSMLGEINTDYYTSIKKAILDYSLKNARERERLGLPIGFHPPTDYGSKPLIGLEPSEEWRNNAVMGAMKIRDTLRVFSKATLELMNIWPEYAKVLFVDLPNDFDCKYLEGFAKEQRIRMEEVKNKLANKWQQDAAEILHKELEYIPTDPPELRKSFFDAVATLMSNQVRSLIENSITAYEEFFKKYKKKTYATAAEVVARKFDISSPIERSFLLLNIDTDGDKGTVKFKEPPHTVQTQLRNVIEDIVKQSCSLPRGENSFNPGENQQLWKVSMDDVLVRGALETVDDVIKDNLQVVKQVLSLYSKYEYILTEKNKLAVFLNDPTKTRDDYQDYITKYSKQKDDIINNLPCEVRMNMFLVDCKDINEKLIKECNELIAELERTISKNLREKADQMIFDYSNLTAKINQKGDNEDLLVATEKALAELKDVKKDEFVARYQDLLEWLMMLLRTSFKVSEEDLVKVKKVQEVIKTLNSLLESNEERLRNDRAELERKLEVRKTNINNQLEIFTKELDKFKDREDPMAGGKNNCEILSGLGAVLKGVKEDIADVNTKEQTLGASPTEYSKIPQMEEKFNNFDKLWTLAKQVEDTTKSWLNSLIFDLDPDIVEKDCADMLKTAGMLAGKLNKEYPKPANKATNLRKRMDQFAKNNDLISSLCNKALSDRHWKNICEVLQLKEITRDDKKYTLSYFEQSGLLANKEKIERLQDISLRATQEATNEKSLKDMIAQWDTFLFQTKEWKKTNTYVLLGSCFEDILQAQEEHLMKTQTMKGSPYAEFIKAQIIDWEQWLDRAAKIINEWKKLQSSWTGLESVFTSEDILQQLPVEGGLFRDVDKAWRELMKDAYTDQKVKKIMEKADLKEVLEKCNTKLEQVNKRLNDYLETKRLAFCRFFFLGNEQLLQILSDAKEPLKVQDHVGSCFDGIGLLDFTPEKKIKGMVSKEGEVIDFVNMVDPSKSKGMVEVWILEVEDQMIISLRNVCDKGAQDYVKMKRDECI